MFKEEENICVALQGERIKFILTVFFKSLIKCMGKRESSAMSEEVEKVLSLLITKSNCHTRYEWRLNASFQCTEL